MALRASCESSPGDHDLAAQRRRRERPHPIRRGEDLDPPPDVRACPRGREDVRLDVGAGDGRSTVPDRLKASVPRPAPGSAERSAAGGVRGSGARAGATSARRTPEPARHDLRRGACCGGEQLPRSTGLEALGRPGANRLRRSIRAGRSRGRPPVPGQPVAAVRLGTISRRSCPLMHVSRRFYKMQDPGSCWCRVAHKAQLWDSSVTENLERAKSRPRGRKYSLQRHHRSAKLRHVRRPDRGRPRRR